MPLCIQTLAYNDLPADILSSLFKKEIDLLHIQGAFPKDKIAHASNQIENKIYNQYKFQLPDGFFYPMPYSAVHLDNGWDKLKLLNTYLEAASYFNRNRENIVGVELHHLLDDFLLKIHINKEDLLKFNELSSFTTFNIRLLEAGKNGIYIHCENSFISELAFEFKERIATQIDLENALSMIVFLQTPEDGGELFLFDTDWDTTPIHLNESSRDIRHISQGVFFTHHGYPKPEQIAVAAQSGDVIIFRAAQIWHTVNSIAGLKNRLSLGCFIGQTKNQTYKYWA